jgi:hypothetical protein
MRGRMLLLDSGRLLETVSISAAEEILVELKGVKGLSLDG